MTVETKIKEDRDPGCTHGSIPGAKLRAQGQIWDLKLAIERGGNGQKIGTWGSRMVEIFDPSLMVVTDPFPIENWRRRVSSGSRIWQSVGTRVGENRDVT